METKQKNTLTTKQGHKLLNWYFHNDAGILTIEPGNDNYANGDTGDDCLYFHDESDAIVQLNWLIALLHRRRYEKDPKQCRGCKQTLPYSVTLTSNWECPSCQTENMGS